ncbi:MAG: universal stress protein [Rhodospirillaceae bacterium]|nr:universal stress protein [Rhodospirillaceae bacterium]
MYETILVPIEMGQIDRAGAMLSAARYLLTTAGRITCLTVLPEIPGYVAADLPRNLDENLVEEANAALSKIINATGVVAAIDIQIGHAAQTILAVAEQTGAELIIIGSHRPGLEDYLLGSTAGRVVRHAASHVLVKR